jgi:hypothetical protein
LFSEGKTPLDAVIILDLPADEVLAIYQVLGTETHA